MKTDNIFDNLDYENTVDDSTLKTPEGVSTERVKDLFMNKINENTASKKHSKRSRIIKVFAFAAAAAVVTGALTVGAAGGFNKVFSQITAGTPEQGVYSGADIKKEEKGNVTVDFEGVTGDDNYAIAGFTLKNKDGSSFVDDYKNTWINSDTQSQLRQTSLLVSFDLHSSPLVDYKLVDNDTIVGYSLVERNFPSYIQNTTLSISNTDLLIYHTEKVLFTEDTEKDVVDSYSELMDNLIENEKKYKGLLKENETVTLENNLTSFVHDGPRRIVIASVKKVNADYMLSARLNYRTETKKFDDCEINKDGKTIKLSNISLQSMTINLNISGTNPDYIWSEENIANYAITVILKDGTKFCANMVSAESSENDSFKGSFIFSPVFDAERRIKFRVIDINEVDKVTFLGEEMPISAQ